ncbi:MAG: peptidoglycan DD-metalloendopeptidase family protein [Cyanobacteria bacterium]|jgi:murein DD-endopeptidase MepM/ murein hydrolase activator NlpD|nr:peptidoglycan DD-metalloendopeptidase family protein [Cyanobacteria bacterium GSL.Bin21]
MVRNYRSVYEIAINRTNFLFRKQRLTLKFLLFSFASVGVISAFSILSQPSVNAQSIARNSSQTGQWLNASFPVENFQTYTSPFGYRQSPTTGRTQFHRGLDLAAPLGSYIRNWWGGRVTQLSDHTACGTMVIIQSGQWEHIYCHLKGHVQKTSAGLVLVDRGGGIRLSQGQQVPTGTRIGRVGMTGRTTGPHLHWGLKYAGEYIDPALVLRQMYQEQAAVQ